MAGFSNDTMFASNVDFSGGKSPTITLDGQLLIGSTASPNIKVGSITSPLGTLNVGYSSPNITLDLVGGISAVEHLTGNTGGALNPTANNFNTLGSGSITISGAASTLTTQLTGLTNHSVLVGAGTATITKVAPSATSGVPLISQGAAADPVFGTAVVAGGGTGAVTLTGVLTGNGTSAFTASTVTQFGVVVGGASNAVATTAVGSTGQVLQGNSGAAPTYSTATFPSTATGTGKILIADGTNWVASTPTFPNTSASSGKFIRSDGTNWIASTPTLPTSAGTSGKVLQSDGTNYVETTATYPSTATGTGTILRADGTNWAATTSTYPNTNAVSTLLYASSANVMSALATANSGVLTTSSGGVPSIDTTNFSVLSTGVQMKGNNTNTAPPAGFIGEQIRSLLPVASRITLTTTTFTNVTSISLTAGIWDVSGVVSFIGTLTGTSSQMSISTTSAAAGTEGDNYIASPTVSTAGSDYSLTIPSYRLTLSSTTTVYLVALTVHTVGTSQAWGRISGTRVG